MKNISIPSFQDLDKILHNKITKEVEDALIHQPADEEIDEAIINGLDDD